MHVIRQTVTSEAFLLSMLFLLLCALVHFPPPRDWRSWLIAVVWFLVLIKMVLVFFAV